MSKQYERCRIALEQTVAVMLAMRNRRNACPAELAALETAVEELQYLADELDPEMTHSDADRHPVI